MSKRGGYSSMAQVLGAGGLPWRVSSRLPNPGLVAAWREAAGEQLASRAAPVCLQEDGVLIIAVKGAVWRQELQMLAPELVARLQAVGQPVAELRLVKARSEAEPPPPPPPPPPLTADQEESIAGLVAGVRDPELRQALANLMRAQLRHQQT